MLNLCVFEGRLTRDPERRTSPMGTPYVIISVAVEGATKKNGEKETLFINAIYYGTPAELIAKHLTKGRGIIVNGRLRQEQIDDRKHPGEKTTVYTLMGNAFDFPISNRKDDQQNPPNPEVELAKPKPKAYQTSPYIGAEVSDDDLPF